jgi:hypothetical protein
VALVHPYCTIPQLRAELSDDGSDLPEALLEKAINAASRAVDAWCGRRFWADETPVARAYLPTERARADVHDIAGTDGLAIATDTAGNGTWATTWDAADYMLGPLNADADGGAYAWWEVLALSGSWPTSGVRPTLQVTARWGWSEVPVQVEEATLLRAVALFKRKNAPYGVADFGEFGPIRITRADPDVIDLLSPFRKVVLA